MDTSNQSLNKPAIAPGSSQAFEHIYQQYARKVYQTCLRVTKDSTAAEDYTQDVFIKVFEKLHLFQHRSTLSTWLYSIAHNHCLTQLRIGKRLPVNTLPDDDEQTGSLVSESSDAMADLPDAVWQAQEAALRALRPADQQLLRLKYEQGLSVEELGQRYNLSTSAVKMRLKRCRDKANIQYRRYYPI
jgi:RNA polymerase sigma-70 factor (ECF subfamily)